VGGLIGGSLREHPWRGSGRGYLARGRLAVPLDYGKLAQREHLQLAREEGW